MISPYNGGNLGNGAIISATIANIRSRIPGVEIVGITLGPEETRQRHAISSFPLAALSRPNYGLNISGDTSGPNGQPSRWSWLKQALKRLKQALRKTPILGTAWRGLRTGVREVCHIVAAARVVRNLDCIIIPGGGALDEFWGGPWGHPWALFKFSVLSSVYRVPFRFMSVGKCVVQHPLSRFFVRTALKLADYRSYRDHTSKAAVQELLPLPHDPVYPDLAYSYPSVDLTVSQRRVEQDKPLIVGISPMVYCNPRVWPLKDEQRYQRYLRELAAAVKWLIKEKHRILFFATDSPDIAGIADIQAMIFDSDADRSQVEVLAGPPGQSVQGHLQAIQQTDVVIASRLHGIILSHLLAIPVVAISYDLKVDVHMAEVGQQQHSVNIDRMDAKTLMERFHAIIDVHERESAHLASVRQRYRTELQAQYDELFGIKEPGCRKAENRLEMIPVLRSSS